MSEELFELYENEHDDELLAEKDNYYLMIEDGKRNGFTYSVYCDDEDPYYRDLRLVYSWLSYYDARRAKDIKKTTIYRQFLDCIEQDKTDYNEDDDEYEDIMYDDDGVVIRSPKKKTSYWDDDDDDDYLYPRYTRSSSSYVNPYFGSSHYYQPPKKEKGYVEKLCKSNTLVFHKDDPSTRMLCQVYEGKGWDVLTTSCNYIDDDELKELFARHERLVFLGHGTPYGLMGMFGPEVAPLMKDKKIFAIWCNADAYFEKHGIGKGQFITGNMPSEVWECSAAGCGSISTELMLENITYWSKLCADVCEACLEGNVKSSVDYIRKNYLELYGNHPVTIYNCNRTQCLGEPQPLPAFTFKGKPLEGKDIPYEGYNQEEFLKNPTEKIPYVTPKYPSNYSSYKKKDDSESESGYKQLSLFDDEEEDQSLTDSDLKRLGITVVDDKKDDDED